MANWIRFAEKNKNKKTNIKLSEKRKNLRGENEAR